MNRRSALALLGATLTGLGGGCLTDGETPGSTDGGTTGSTDCETGGSTFDGDPAALVETLQIGIPRGAGESLFETGNSRLAYVVRSRSQAETVFDVEQLDDEQARADGRAFVEHTEFDSEVLLQIEERVANTGIRVQLSDFTVQDCEGVVVYATEDLVASGSVGGSASAERVRRLLLRIDTATGGVQSFTVEYDGASFSPVSVGDLR